MPVRDNMKLTLALCILGAMCLHLGQAYDRRRMETSGKVSKPDEKMNIIINELRRLKADVKALKEDSNPQPQPKLLPVAVTQQTLTNGKIKLTLKYKAARDVTLDVNTFWMDMEKFVPLEEHVSNEIPTFLGSNDIYSSSVVMDASNETHVSVAVGTPRMWYRVYIKPTSQDDETHRITSLPEGKVMPPGDIVYEPGTNATINVISPAKKKPRHPGEIPAPDGDIEFYITPPGTNTILQKYTRPGGQENFIQMKDETKYLDSSEYTLTFNTSKVSYSGLIEFTDGRNFPDEMVYRIDTTDRRVLRPSNQTDAFPDSFIAVRQQDWLVTDANGNLLQRCSHLEECQVFCQFFSTRPQPIQVFKTIGGQTEIATPETQLTERYSSYAIMKVRMEAGNPPVNYTCIGSDASGSQAVTTIIAKLRPGPFFVENESSLVISDDGMVILTCTAWGDPQPTVAVTFQLQNSGDMYYNDLDILYQTNGTISASKVIPLSDLVHSSRQPSPDSLQGALCEARNSWGSDTHYLPNSF